MEYYQQELERQNEIWNYQLKNLFNHSREKTELSSYLLFRKMLQNCYH